MEYCLSETSLSHTYGNVTCFITEYIKSLFPENYFKTIHVSSTIAYRQFSIYKNKNAKEFLKKSKPMLIIRPRIDMNNNNAFLMGTLLTERMYDTFDKDSWSNLQPFMEDEKNGMYMRFLLNRLTLLFDITIITETQMEQINQAYFLKNRITPEHPFILTTTLENYIPKDFIEVLSKAVDKPIYDDNGSVQPFMEYLNGISIYPISYKLKDSSGNDEFFRFYPVNIYTNISTIDIDDGSKKGVVSDTYSITFNVYTEFNSSGLYYLFSDKIPLIKKFIMNAVINKNQIIPLFTVDYEQEESIADGWNIVSAPIYTVDEKGKDDITDLRALFNSSIYTMMSYHDNKGIPYNTFINITVKKDSQPLEYGPRGFEIDWKNLQLITHKTNPSSTYRLFIHINTLYINTLIKDVLDLDRIDTKELLKRVRGN